MPEPETPDDQLIEDLRPTYPKGRPIPAHSALAMAMGRQDAYREGWAARDALAQKQQAQLVGACEDTVTWCREAIAACEAAAAAAAAEKEKP